MYATMRITSLSFRGIYKQLFLVPHVNFKLQIRKLPTYVADVTPLHVSDIPPTTIIGVRYCVCLNFAIGSSNLNNLLTCMHAYWLHVTN